MSVKIGFIGSTTYLKIDCLVSIHDNIFLGTLGICSIYVFQCAFQTLVFG